MEVFDERDSYWKSDDMITEARIFLLSLTISLILLWVAIWYIVVPTFVQPYIEHWKRQQVLRGGHWKKMKKSLDQLNKLLDDIERDRLARGHEKEASSKTNPR
jgi:hypothetical protein